jgi:hypothetical protein
VSDLPRFIAAHELALVPVSMSSRRPADSLPTLFLRAAQEKMTVAPLLTRLDERHL